VRLSAWIYDFSSTHRTSASWLNLVERWFALITSQAIRRGSFDSTRRLEQAIMRWLANARPFRWAKSAADVKAPAYQCYCHLRDPTLLKPVLAQIDPVNRGRSHFGYLAHTIRTR
jgi:hypothetical protein